MRIVAGLAATAVWMGERKAVIEIQQGIETPNRGSCRERLATNSPADKTPW